MFLKIFNIKTKLLNIILKAFYKRLAPINVFKAGIW